MISAICKVVNIVVSTFKHIIARGHQLVNTFITTLAICINFQPADAHISQMLLFGHCSRAVNKANNDKKTPHGIIETAGGLVSAFSSQQYLGKARGLEDLHDALRDVYDRKALLASQPFPYYQQRAQACRGDIVEIGEVDADPLHLSFR